MAVRTNSPQIKALKIAAEERFGAPVESRSDFSRLAADIEAIVGEHLSENTLRRLWGRIPGYETTFTRTLDVICRYVGYSHWSHFLSAMACRDGRESDIVVGTQAIKTEELMPGDRIRIGWLPDRMCEVEYIGGRAFRAISAENSTLQAGDTFECSLFLKGYPLFVDNLLHGGEHCQRYSIGLNHGLTTLERL